MVLPLALNYFSSEKAKHSNGFILVVTSLSLIGVLMLRTFVLYAGQMTVI
jgi:protein NrfD